MLYIVLVLVIAAFGLLIAALATANTVWAWVSVGISVVAAGLLVFDWVRGRRRVAATSAPRQAGPVDNGRVPSGFDDGAATGLIERQESVEPAMPPPPPPPPARDFEPLEPVGQAPERAGDDGEPGEEQTDASDLLVVSGLSVEVRVVDEYPRYHLAHCTWLSGKQTIPLPVSEARELGFTPCARCAPDFALAAKHRAGRGATQ